MSPLSEFPESKKEYKTFAEYYDKNYNIKIKKIFISVVVYNHNKI